MKKFINSSTATTINNGFKILLFEINNNGLESNPRGQKVKEIYLKQIPIDPLFPIIDFPSRKFPFKYLAGELAWYLNKDKNTNYIDNFSSFWKNIKDEKNEVNSNYGSLLFGKQLLWVKESLKKDKDTRQAIAFVNKPDFQYENNKDFVCTIYLNFFIREDELNMKVTMRSNDAFYGLSFDAPFFSFVLQHMYLWLKEEKYPELKLGTYFHYADNIHFYEHHFERAEKIINEIGTEYTFELKKPMFYVDGNGMFIFKRTPEATQFITDVLELKKENKDTEEYIKLLNNFIKIEKLNYGKQNGIY